MIKEDSLSGKRILRSFFIDRKQIERLNRLSAITRVPQVVYVREGIDLALNKHERNLRKKRR